MIAPPLSGCISERPGALPCRYGVRATSGHPRGRARHAHAAGHQVRTQGDAAGRGPAHHPVRGGGGGGGRHRGDRDGAGARPRRRPRAFRGWGAHRGDRPRAGRRSPSPSACWRRSDWQRSPSSSSGSRWGRVTPSSGRNRISQANRSRCCSRTTSSWARRRARRSSWRPTRAAKPAAVIAVQQVAPEQVPQYGIVDPDGPGDPTRLRGIVEKPSRERGALRPGRGGTVRARTLHLRPA